MASRRPGRSLPARASRRARDHLGHVRAGRVHLRRPASRRLGFLVKDTNAAELLRAVRVVAAGEALLSPAVTRRLIAEFTARTAGLTQVAGVNELTPREREVASLIATGLSNEEIGGRSYVSPSAVKAHVARAMMKLRASDRAQLVVFAYQAGLAPGGPSG
jgi:DNA-binding NarL/FixJ family response regulator